MDTIPLYLILAATALVAIALIAVTGLNGFKAWIDLKRSELQATGAAPVSNAGNRIEMADLKERLRKLEAIAAGVDL
jgi:hypothetical protein